MTKYKLISILMFVCCCFASVSQASTMTSPFKVAAVELNPQFSEFEKNLPNITAAAADAAKNGAKLIVLPEMVTSGYIYTDRDQIQPFLDTIPGKTTAQLEKVAKKYHVYIAVGIAEIDSVSNLAYNAAALIGPDGYIGKYRKIGLNSDDTRWATQGNLGIPVFDTEIGKIALVICYDDSYLQSLLLPSLRGANIIAYLTASGRIPAAESGSQFNHSTIANIASLSGWVGTYIIGTSRTGTEKNLADDRVADYVGGASIWDPNGKNLAQAAASSLGHDITPETIYAEINPKLYQNSAKSILQMRRRPELYQIFNLYRSPIDPEASTTSRKVGALLVQYTPVPGDVAANLTKVTKLLQGSVTHDTNLILLPENSLVGTVDDDKKMSELSENMQGDSIKKLALLAKKYHSYLAFSMPEKDNGKLYASAVLIDDEGEVIGRYRKSHLNEDESQWATAGDDMPVFDTKLGKIAFIIGDEVRIPDIANVYAMKRADIILIPTAWKAEYGREVFIDPGLLTKPYPKNTMTFWYSIAKYSQAYTLVANYVGGAEGYKGSSALYSLDPVMAHYIPEVASDKDETVLVTHFNTLGDKNWWMNQQYLIAGQHVALNAPLTLNYSSSCFKQWQTDGTGNHFCWHQ